MVSRIQIIIFILFMFLLNGLSAGQKYVKIEDLNGAWRFNLGDDKKWAIPNFDDSDWDAVDVPSRWEDQGYNGYDGYAWYRKGFKIKPSYSDQNLFLSLGVIDDVAEIYINGNLVGVSGSLPPAYETAYNTKIWLPLPKNVLQKNEYNTIAVRVYDNSGEGGIYQGDVGIFIAETPLKLLVNLEGLWKFNTGDNFQWKKIKFDDSNWKELTVPSVWDHQGYKDYDGYAWYRIKFSVDLNKNVFDEDLVLMLGKIDDIDETYLNEKFIGSTGDLLMMPIISNFNSACNVEYSWLRGYRINKSDLLNGENVLAVRVYDGFALGGIYEGPVGMVTLKDYVNYRTRSLDKKKKNFMEILFD